MTDQQAQASDTGMLVVITGPDGSGKSTACQTVSELFESRYGQSRIAVASPWDAAPELFASPINAHNYLNSLDGPARALFILSGIQSALRLAKRKAPQVILFDSYWYKYVVCEIARGASNAWLFEVVKLFPQPDLVVYLEITPKDAAMRKISIKHYESGISTGTPELEHFIDFQTQLQPVWQQVEARTGSWKHLSALSSKNQIAQQILKEISKKVTWL